MEMSGLTPVSGKVAGDSGEWLCDAGMAQVTGWDCGWPSPALWEESGFRSQRSLGLCGEEGEREAVLGG